MGRHVRAQRKKSEIYLFRSGRRLSIPIGGNCTVKHFS